MWLALTKYFVYLSFILNIACGVWVFFGIVRWIRDLQPPPNPPGKAGPTPEPTFSSSPYKKGVLRGSFLAEGPCCRIWASRKDSSPSRRPAAPRNVGKAALLPASPRARVPALIVLSATSVPKPLHHAPAFLPAIPCPGERASGRGLPPEGKRAFPVKRHIPPPLPPRECDYRPRRWKRPSPASPPTLHRQSTKSIICRHFV